jgi:hypothetical protein
MHASPATPTFRDPACRFSAERDIAARRLRTALAISLSIHIAAISIGGGNIGTSSEEIALQAQLAAGAPAPLKIHLAPLQLELPQSIRKTRSLRAFPATTPTVASEGIDTGGSSTQLSPQPARAAEQSRFGAPAPVYFDAEQLTRQPEPLKDIDPDPPTVRERSGSGKAIMVLFINEAGQIDRVQVETSGLDDVLLAGVVEEFRGIRFQPAEINAVRVKSRMRIEVLVRPIMQP